MIETHVVAMLVATLAIGTIGVFAEILTECPVTDLRNTTVFIVHETDCSKYYRCYNGEKILMECASTNFDEHRLHFNPVLQICGSPNSVDCTNGKDGNIKTTDEEAEVTSVKVPTECSSYDDIYAVHLAHESNCNLFYICKYGNKILRQCPSGLHFNAVLQVCDWPYNAGCSNSITRIKVDEVDAIAVQSNKCPTGSSAHISHEFNCEQYYTCNHGNKVLRQCPTGLHFNVALQICDWPNNAGCSNSNDAGSTIDDNASENNTCSSGNTDTLHIPHESNCRLFYTCSNGIKVLKRCPSILHFNVILQVCDWPERAGCSSSNVGGTESGDEASTEENDTSTVESNECPSDGDNTLVHLPHETNCNLFYKCAYGQKIPHQCPAGLHFNPQLNVCDWPEQAGCSSNGGGTESGEEVSTEETDTSTVESNECPSDGDNTLVHLPHETNCSLFYKCAYGQKVVQHCPPGLHFNPQLNVCDWPEQAGCSSNVGGTESGDEISTEETDTSTVESNECPSDGDNTLVHLPHETNCSLFYKCAYGQKVVQHCPPGLHFNPQLNVCDWPEQAGCSSNVGGTESGEEVSTEETDTSTVESNECPSDGDNTLVHLPHETNCSLFYKCTYGQKVVQHCPPGLHFNPQLNVCDWPEQAGCSSNGGGTESGEEVSTEENGPVGSDECSSDNSDTIAHLPHESNCNLFYTCVYGNKVVQKCPTGLHFNAQLQTCDWPENARCESDIEEPNNSTTDATGGDQSSVGPISGSEFCIGNCPTTDPPMLVLLPHEECPKFCKCSNGLPYVYRCPSGLHFNNELLVCDYREVAGCEEIISSSTIDSTISNSDNTVTPSNLEIDL